MPDGGATTPNSLILAAIQPWSQSPGGHQPQHAEIAEKRPPGMAKGRRLIPFNQKVPRPGNAVANGKPEEGPPRMSQGERQNHDQQSQ